MHLHSGMVSGGRQIRLWTGFLGGAVAWFVHFLLVYVLSEWRCVAPLPDVRVLGMTGTAWILLGVSVVLFAAACAATVVAHRIPARPKDGDETEGAAAFMARTGVYTSGLFAFIILIESIPIFFFRTSC
jgi:hypothetical protein